MFNIGIDFDNTIVDYDNSFYELALEKKLINKNIKKSKKSIRSFLKNEGKEDEFTILQGEVYGPRILKATPANECLNTIKKLNDLGANVFIVSHKTKTPYAGPKYDLHNAAKEWLNHYLFLSSKGGNIKEDRIFFNTSKSEKISRIHYLKCNFFIDDLPEILDMVNPNIKRILYNNNEEFYKSKYSFVSNKWKLVGDFIEKNL
mgnify:CR=1 FL=1